MPIDRLTAAVERLDRNTEKVIRTQRIRMWFVAIAATLVAVSFWAGLAVAYAKIDNNTDDIRTDLQADCPFYRDIGNSPIDPWTGGIARSLVQNARNAYEDKCAVRFGPLNKRDPDADRPIQPSPTAR